MKRFKASVFMSESAVKLCNSAMRFGYLVFPGLTFAGCFEKKKKNGKQMVTSWGNDVIGMPSRTFWSNSSSSEFTDTSTPRSMSRI